MFSNCDCSNLCVNIGAIKVSPPLGAVSAAGCTEGVTELLLAAAGSLQAFSATAAPAALFTNSVSSMSANWAAIPAKAAIFSTPRGWRWQLCCSCFMQDSSSDRSAGLPPLSLTCCSRAVRSSSSKDCHSSLVVCDRAKMMPSARSSPVLLYSSGAVDAFQSWRTAASREGMLAAGLLKMARDARRPWGSMEGSPKTAGRKSM